ncbi:MAG: FAD-binding protein [Clostridia bacterium]|nr:FAD-binding protein [Clostridia bacterium]
MKILVCVKVIQGEINPFDASALECALTLSSDVTVVSMGPEKTKETLLPLTRLGAKVVLISDNIYAGSDTLATSYILSEAIKKMDYDLILCGRQSVDGDTAQVGPMLSEKLGISLITGAMSVETDSDSVSAKTREGEEKISLPALVTVERGYILRFPSIFSKQGEVEIINNSLIGCDEEKCGLKGSPTRVLKTFENTSGKRKCKFISFDELPSLVESLRNTQKKEETEEEIPEKLESVWVIGEEVLEKAKKIVKNVTVIDKLPPKEIFEKIEREKPQFVLWNADQWGRKNASIVAAMLSTGLCADCTHLETDGEDLYMYRPAQGGNITAKIRCLTKPVMATVRTKQSSSDVIVSLGKGAKDSIEKGKKLAETLNAELGASRGLVDANLAPYKHQIGLTGKTVSPKVYIAIGISGAVHHTCAIEGADTVIAINPDKDARIFEYADYGILENF